jgi:hypothetical protein
MALNSNQGGDEGRKVSGETIRRFLLGLLSTAEQPAFEESLFVDEGLNTRVRLAELDLADDYAFERLSAEERVLFEKRFLLTQDRRRMLQVSEGLRQRLSSQPVAGAEKRRVLDRLRHLLRFNRPAWRFAFGVVIFLLLFGTAWLVIKEPRIADQITKRIHPRRSPVPSASREAAHPIGTSSPEHQSTPSPMPVHEQTTAPVEPAVVNLAPAGAPSNEMPAFTLPLGAADVVRLQLNLNPDQAGPFRVELMTVDGSTVYRGDSAGVGANSRIDFDVSARLLKKGDYQIKLSRNREGSPEAIGTYYFRLN